MTTLVADKEGDFLFGRHMLEKEEEEEEEEAEEKEEENVEEERVENGLGRMLSLLMTL